MRRRLFQAVPDLEIHVEPVTSHRDTGVKPRQAVTFSEGQCFFSFLPNQSLIRHNMSHCSVFVSSTSEVAATITSHATEAHEAHQHTSAHFKAPPPVELC